MQKYKLAEGEARLLVAMFDHLKPYYEQAKAKGTSVADEMNNANTEDLNSCTSLLRTALRTLLNDRGYVVIKQRYGLSTDGKRHTLEEIGREFDVTRERIRQVESKTLRKIKRYMTELNDEETARTVSELQDRETEYLRSPDANLDQDEMLRDICIHNWEVFISAHRKLKIQQAIRKYREQNE